MSIFSVSWRGEVELLLQHLCKRFGILIRRGAFCVEL
ncbi:unnamed protein product [Ascophyllum nodosum]